jgi:chromosome partitioning protein
MALESAATPHRLLKPLAGCRVIAVALEKGGVAKTTTCVTLGHALALRGRRVLLIDLDPQHNLTAYVGDPEAPIVLADVLRKPDLLDAAISASSAGTAQILNGSRDTALVADEIKMQSKAPSVHLRRLLQRVTDRYDYVFVDCARTIDLMSINALAAATEVIAPIDGEPMAVAGLGQIRQSLIELAEAEVINLPPPPIHVLLTKYDPKPKATQETIAYVRAQIDVPIYETVIRYSRHAIGSFPTQMTVLDFAPKSSVSNDYIALAEEIDGEQ